MPQTHLIQINEHFDHEYSVCDDSPVKFIQHSTPKRQPLQNLACSTNTLSDLDAPCDVSGLSEPTGSFLSSAQHQHSSHIKESNVSTASTSGLAAPLDDSERVILYTEIDNLRAEKEALQEKLDSTDLLLETSRLKPEAVLHNDKKVKYLTGLSSETFQTLSRHLHDTAPPKFIRKKTIPFAQQLLIALVRLRHDIPFNYLALHTGYTKSTIADHFWRIIDLLHAKIDFLIHWPDRETMRATNPPVFKAHFPRLTGIMDCFEIFIQRPKNLKARAEVYSNYKKHSTMKAFVVCSPLGAVTFISTVWGGRASDIEIVRESGFISADLHQPGDQLLADRGFTLKEDFAVVCGAELLYPSFIKGHRQLSPQDLETSRKILHVRIHIERVIGLIKKRFTILCGPLPIPQVKSLKDEAWDLDLSSADKLVRVCGALTNLGNGIVYKEDSVTD